MNLPWPTSIRNMRHGCDRHGMLKYAQLQKLHRSLLSAFTPSEFERLVRSGELPRRFLEK
jgi:hypothetical protein